MRYCSCGGDSRVLDSRADCKWKHIWRRRRECMTCGTRWTTLEVPAETIDAMAPILSGVDRLADALRFATAPLRRGKSRKEAA